MSKPRVFVPDKPFQLSQIFAGKARSLVCHFHSGLISADKAGSVAIERNPDWGSLDSRW